MTDTRPYFFVYFEDTKKWGFIANNGMNNVVGRSLALLQEWRTVSENKSEISTFSLLRVIYSKELARLEIQKASSTSSTDLPTSLMMGPDLYIIRKHDVENEKSHVAIVWHPSHLEGFIDLTLTSGSNALMDCKSSFDDIRNAFGNLLNCKIEVSHESEYASRVWHVLE